jgi:N6-L-threonylcarbamoyladenine synthase
MKVLAIDTSADETSCAITDDQRVLCSLRASQITTHRQWGGIVPSIARLAHKEKIDRVVDIVVSRAKSRGVKHVSDINAIAVTIGPGLAPALEVGIQKAKELSCVWNIPLLAANHMEGHLYSAFVQNAHGLPVREVMYPFIGFLISGGHTELVLASGNGNYTLLGKTRDDAAGEAIDKAARMLGLGYPGGEVIERLALQVGNRDRFRFPRPMWADTRLTMSFSGLKTHFFYLIRGEKKVAIDLARDVCDLASSFQEAVFSVLAKRLYEAIELTGVKRVVCGGGVVVNRRLRWYLRKTAKTCGSSIMFPAYRYLCGDNAAMIAFTGVLMAKRGEFVRDVHALQRQPRLSLQADTIPGKMQ